MWIEALVRSVSVSAGPLNFGLILKVLRDASGLHVLLYVVTQKECCIVQARYGLFQYDAANGEITQILWVASVRFVLCTVCARMSRPTFAVIFIFFTDK
jgi:hypothetical protein